MDNFMTLTAEELKRAYNNENIILSNQAVGGKTSGWGAEDAQTLKLANEHPDLLYIHFGINDLGGQNSAESYYKLRLRSRFNQGFQRQPRYIRSGGF